MDGLVPGVGSCLTVTINPLVNMALKGTLDAYRPESCLTPCRRAIWSLPSSVLTPSREGYGTSGIFSVLSHFPPCQQTQGHRPVPRVLLLRGVAVTQAHSPRAPGKCWRVGLTGQHNNKVAANEMGPCVICGTNQSSLVPQ